MKYIAVILGVTVYLLLVATEGQAKDLAQANVKEQMLEDLADLLRVKKTQNEQPQIDHPSRFLSLESLDSSQSKDEAQTIVEQQMLEDLAGILRVKNKQNAQPQMDYPPLKKGQIISRCSYYKYGCCQDGKTEAKGPNRKGCGERVCADNSVAYCMEHKNKLDCRKGSDDYERCTFTCSGGQCAKKAPAQSKLQKCLNSRTRYGCCWNGFVAVTPNKRDCLPCRDLTPNTCRQFRSISGGCLSGSYGIRTFMQKYCPRTCGQCFRKK